MIYFQRFLLESVKLLFISVSTENVIKRCEPNFRESNFAWYIAEEIALKLSKKRK